jgi:cell division protein FtsN
MADEGVREIQLDGKQLVVVFMTAAVVLAATFLFGVYVGRGVKAQKDPAPAAEPGASVAAAAADPGPGPGGVMPRAEPSSPATQPPSTPPPAPPEEDLSYYQRLEASGKPGASTKPLPPAPADPKAQKAVDAKAKAQAASVPATGAAPASAAPAPASAPPAAGEPAGAGFALRVAAYSGRAQADAVAARLAAKGYTTWVVQLPTANGRGLFSVRVGKYRTSKEADAAKRRLQKEGYQPSLITR